MELIAQIALGVIVGGLTIALLVTVIEIVRTGERDPERIRQEVLGRRS